MAVLSAAGPSRRILLLGASGYVGGGLWTSLSARHEVVGTCHYREIDGLVRLDLRDDSALVALLRDGFDLVIHCAGLVDLTAAQTRPALAHQLNVTSVRMVRDALRDTATKLVLLSSDNVFDGTRESYSELDTPAPINGHVEWTTIARSDRVPVAGEVIHAEVSWEGPAGGGAVAAVQLARLAGQCSFFTALGDDAAGRQAGEQLGALGVQVLAAARNERTRQAVSLVDASGERTTTTLGSRLQPTAADPLPWPELSGYDAVFFTAGDTGALRAARQASTLVVTSRELQIVASARVAVDALVGSLRDPEERYDPTALIAPPTLLVGTDGADGGIFEVCGGPTARYRAAEPPGPTADLYGVGDTFAATLTFALGSGADVATALSFAAGHGADATTRTGPYPITAPAV